MPASDATLVQGVLSGDRNAFAELYDRWAGLIRAMCFDVTRDLDTAEDLAQEVFLRALRKLGDLRDPPRFVSWLMGIARHVCREWRRGRFQNQRRLTSLTDDLPSPRKIPRRTTAARYCVRLLRPCLSGSGSACRPSTCWAWMPSKPALHWA